LFKERSGEQLQNNKDQTLILFLEINMTSYLQKRMLEEFQVATQLEKRQSTKILQQAKWDLPKAIEIYDQKFNRHCREEESPNIQENQSLLQRAFNSYDKGILIELILWSFLLLVSVYIEFCTVYLLLSALYFLFRFTGSRKQGEASAYSVFNKDCKPIAGTFDSEKMKPYSLLGL
jgi:hypothetical protein